MKNIITALFCLFALFQYSCSKTSTPGPTDNNNNNGTNASDTIFGFSFDVGSTHYNFTGANLSSVNLGGNLVQKWELKDSTFKLMPGALLINDKAIKLGSISYKDLDMQYLNTSSVRYCWGKSLSSSVVYGNAGSFEIKSTNTTRKFISGTFSGYFHAFYTPSDSVYVSNGKFKGLRVQNPIP